MNEQIPLTPTSSLYVDATNKNGGLVYSGFRLLQSDMMHSDMNEKTYSETRIFLGINILIAVLLIVSICCYCYIFRSRLENISRTEMNHEFTFERNIRDQQQRRAVIESMGGAIPPTVRDGNDDHNDDDEEETAEKRQERVKESFLRNNVTMVIKESDFCNEMSESFNIEDDSNKDRDITTTGTGISDNEIDLEQQINNNESVVVANDETNNGIDECELGYVYIGNDTDPSTPRRRVPNCCAICLCSYATGETIVWNSRKLCQHAFHSECMIHWLTKMRDGTPCPCCRQEFTDIPMIPQRRKETTTTTAQYRVPINLIDLRLISFR